MQKRVLGRGGLVVSALGLGCLGMSDYYGNRDDAESEATLRRALELGVTLLDTADVYGGGDNEELVGRALRGARKHVVLATKFGLIRGASGGFAGIDGSPEYVRRACDASLKRLATDYIDLYYQHRVDPRTPIEETVGALSELVREGKVRFIGLCEAAPQTIRRAHAIHPIAAVQTEYSVWTTEPAETTLTVCRELGIGFVAYSPLGRGFLTGALKRTTDIPENDYRRTNPRFLEENFRQNRLFLDHLEELAKRVGHTPAQLALGWLLAKGDDIVPLPGTKRQRYLEENLGALDVGLDSKVLSEIGELLSRYPIAGPRYSGASMELIDRGSV